MPSDHRFLINGVRWLWRYCRLRGRADGWTYLSNDAGQGNLKILISEQARGRYRLQLEIHEFLHASNPTISEEHVTQMGRDLARILYALGYRRTR